MEIIKLLARIGGLFRARAEHILAKLVAAYACGGFDAAAIFRRSVAVGSIEPSPKRRLICADGARKRGLASGDFDGFLQRRMCLHAVTLPRSRLFVNRYSLLLRYRKCGAISL